MIIDPTGAAARPVASDIFGRLNARSLLCISWLILVVWLTWHSFVTEIRYFRSPGPQFYRLLLVALAVSPAAVWIFQRLRRRGLWRYELAGIAAVPVAASFFYEPRAAATTWIVVLAGFTLGRRARRALGVDAGSPAEDLAVSIGMGLGLLQCVLFLIGLAGGFTVPVFLALTAAMLCIGWRELPEFWRDIRAMQRAWAETGGELASWPGALTTVFAAALAVSGAMVMLAPSIAFDMVANHLPLAHYYAAQHAMETPQYLRYGYFPQGVEILMTMGYVLGGDAATQMLPAVYLVLTLLLVFRIARLCGHDRFTAMAGTVFAAACPFIHWSGSVGKNDLAVAFFILASLHAYLRWRDTASFPQILASSFFLAMAAGVKLTVAFAVAPLGLFLLYALGKQEKPWRAALKVAAVVLVFGVFWYVRTWSLTGLLVDPNAVSRESVLKHPPPGAWGPLRPFLRAAWLVSDVTHRGFESPLDRPAGVVLPLFIGFWFLAARRKNPAETMCLLFCALYLLIWSQVMGKIRFAIAPVLLLIMLTGTRVVLFGRSASPALRVIVLAASAYALAFGLFGTAIIELNAPQLRYFAGRIDRTGYIREAMRSYRAMEFLQPRVTPGDRVLSVATCALLYTPQPQAFDCVQPARLSPDARVPIDLRRYRFFLAPVISQKLLPAEGWKTIYSDETFLVGERGGR